MGRRTAQQLLCWGGGGLGRVAIGNWQTTPTVMTFHGPCASQCAAETLYTFSFSANELNPPAAHLIAHEGPRKLTRNIPEK
jgi:hypothetical protein